MAHQDDLGKTNGGNDFAADDDLDPRFDASPGAQPGKQVTAQDEKDRNSRVQSTREE